ncbi:MAG TPA: hypothetical protein DCP26_03180 [Brevundimonas sp.]|nr:hypothetical protein [Brevundimonas sp.]
MHPASRALLLGQADAEERKAEYKAVEAQKLLADAIELDNEAAACRATAKALRADAEAKPVEVLTVRLDASEVDKVIAEAMAEVRASRAHARCLRLEPDLRTFADFV